MLSPASMPELSLPTSKIKDYGSGELSNRILGDSEYIASWHGAGIVTLFAELVWLVTALGLMAMYSLWTMILVVVTILVGLRVSKHIQKRIAVITEEFQEISAVVNTKLIEFIQGHDEIKSFNSTEFFYKKMEDLIEGEQELVASKMTMQYALYIVVNAFMAYALSSIVVISGMIFALRGEMSLGSILALYALTQQIQELIRMVTEMNQDKETSSAMENRNEFLIVENEGLAGGIDTPLEQANLSIDQFSYDDKSILLKDINLRLSAQDLTFIMGKSGSGKSTLARILAGKIILSGEQGKFQWNDETMNESKALTANSCLIARQEPYIFSGTIRDNLLFGHGKTDDQLKLALQLSCFDEVVDEYGLDYSMNEQGKNLSGGQRQRLSICRALLRKPSLLILDEPSSALNNDLGRKMVDSIRHYYQNINMSLIILTHDEGLVGDSDRVLYL